MWLFGPLWVRVPLKYIFPDKNVSFAIWLKKNREKSGLSQKDVVEKFNIAYQTYQ